MTGRELVSQIDSAIERRHLLRHRFYHKWQAGTLSRPKLQLYAAQYYWHVEAFPVHLKDLSGRTTGRLHDVVLENLAEEEDPATPHAKLWRDFAASVGLNEESLWFSAPLPGVETLLRIYRKICREHPAAEAVAALYAYEAQVPEIATSKIEGLRRHYGVTSKKGLAYFAVHEEADRLHRAAWRDWLKESTAGVEPDRVLATTETALLALWGALDAVEEAAD